MRYLIEYFQFCTNYTNQAHQLSNFTKVAKKTKILKIHPFLTTSASNHLNAIKP